MNKAILIGRLGKDPEFKTIGSKETPMAKFSIATNSRGQSEWHNIVVWGKAAEICDKYLKKGAQISLDGEIKTNSWESEGVKKYMTEIHTYNINMLGKSEYKDEAEKSMPFDNFGSESKDEIPF